MWRNSSESPADDSLKTLRRIWTNLSAWQRRRLLWRAYVIGIPIVAYLALRRHDIWLFPALIFIAAFNMTSQLVSWIHPMGWITVVATSVMAGTLAMMALAPLTGRKQ